MFTASLGSPDRKRRFLQFRLRTYFVGIGVIAIGLGWYANSANRQRKAVRPVLARGGIIEYDYQYDAVRGSRVPTGKPSRPAWLQRLLSDDYFHGVVTVGMDVDQSDHAIVPTDDDLTNLEGLHELRFLYLGGGRITDNGLGHLKNLTELRLLILSGNPIEGEGLKHLCELKKLRHLDLSNTSETDDQLIYLKHLTGLERIDLPGNPQLSGSFLEHVADLPHLTSLVLRQSGITDPALVHLKRAKGLQVLMLDNTQVTDAGMVYLRGLPNLRSLNLSGTAVSQATVKEISERFPKASVKPSIAKQEP